MSICAVHLVAFSPTHTSKQVGEAVVQGTGVSEIMKTDLTLHPAGELEIPENILAVATVPIYGGKVAPLALKRMRGIHTSDAPAVLVVVYDSRVYEKALVEPDAFAPERGFKMIVGGTFVSEHSYSTEQNPIAVGQPDVDDLQFTKAFGTKIRTKVEAAAEVDKLYAVDVNRIQRPYQAFFPLFRSLQKVVRLCKGGVPMPHIPAVDTELYSHCGYCTVHCPTSATKKGDEYYTDTERCIRCYACVKGCPRKAHTFDTPFATLLADCFKRQKENRIIL